MTPTTSPSQPLPATDSTGRLELHAAGRFVREGHGAIDLEPKDALLLAYLAIEGPTPRGRLAGLLWPEVDDERARGNLRQRLLRLKRTFGVELVAGQAQLALAPGVGHDLDSAEELLAGLDAKQAVGLEAWLATQRERRRHERADRLEAAAQRAETEGDLAAALEHAHALIALDPLSEHAHRRVMKLHYLRGDVAAAMAAYDQCRQTLERELGVVPSRETEAMRAGFVPALDPPSRPLAVRTVPLSVLRPPRLIGRDAEWAALQDAWDAAQPAVVLGEAGVGKSRLVGDFARAHGDAVIVSARPGDERVVYALAARLLQLLPKETVAALAAQVRAELARLLPEFGEAPPMASEAGRVRFIHAVGAALGAAAQRLAIVVIDDLHFADDASIELIQYLCQDSPLRWLLAGRPGELGGTAAALVDTLRARSVPRVVALTPLTQAQLVEFVDALGIEGPSGAALAPALMRQTGGNPLFVLEALKAWLVQGQGETPARLPVTASLGAMVERRIGRLSADAVRLARCAAVAGQDFSAELAAQLLGVRPLDLADAWTELEMAQVFRDGAFAHDLIHEAALASVPPPIARHLHGELARHLSRLGSLPGREADHWLAAGEHEQALPALLKAARLAHDAMRMKEAADLFACAADVAERIGRREDAFAACSGLFESYVALDRARLDEALLERLDRLAVDDEQKARVLSMRGHALLHQGHYTESVTLAKRAAERARAAGNEELAVACLTDAAGAASFMGDSAHAVQILRPLLPWALQQGTDHLQIQVLGQLAFCLDNIDQQAEAKELHRRAVDAALRAGRFDEAVAALGNLAVSQIDIGNSRAALQAIQEARRWLAAHGDAAASAFLLNMNESAALRDLRHYDAALRASELALQDMTFNAVGTAAARVHRTCLWIHLAQYARAQREFTTIPDFDTLPGWTQARAHQMRGRTLWSQGHRGEAARHWDLAATLAPTEGRAVLVAMIALDRALADAPADALACARDVLHRAERFGHLGTALAARIRLVRFASACGDATLAVRAAREALDVDPAIEPNDLYRGELWLVAAQAMIDAGHQSEADRVLREAASTIRRIADESVPAEFRDSFLNRNPVNLELLALASRALS